MKLKSFLILGCITAVMTIISCSGDDGTDGINGIDGTNGTNGINGQDGADGTNGQNGTDASAQKIIVDISEVPGNISKIDIAVPELTDEILQNNTLIFFIESINPDGSIFIPVPGRVFELDRQFDIYFHVGELTITVSDYDGFSLEDWIPGIFTNLHIALIKTSTLQGKNAQENVMASLKANGVDINNYHQVMHYLGLE